MRLTDVLSVTRYSGFLSLAEWARYRQHNEGRLSSCWLLSQNLAGAFDYNAFPGFCVPCGQPRMFAIPQQFPPPDGVWDFRDHANCEGCGLNARVRLGFELLLRLVEPAPARQVYLTEQFGPAYAWLLQHYPQAVGSEFAPDPADHPRLQKILRHMPGPAATQELRHEDVTALRFASASLDAVVSFDVLEHVPDHRAALEQFARVLKPGGYALLTAPFLHEQQATLTRARFTDDGRIEHLLAPEYHGDPLDPSGGVLCWHHFGWDVLQSLHASGFRDARSVLAWSLYKGLPSLSWIWVAQR